MIHLNKKYDFTKSKYYKAYGGKDTSKKEYTIWQKMIKEYNRNTSENKENYVKLPLNLPIPDYTKLAK